MKKVYNNFLWNNQSEDQSDILINQPTNNE